LSESCGLTVKLSYPPLRWIILTSVLR